MIPFTYRPISTWPGPRTPAIDRRTGGNFRTSREDTLRQLSYEIERLDGERAVIEVAMDPKEFRNNGTPRADARWPSADPGVIVSFESKHGPLRYATDVYLRWEHNLRGIALGLEALRAVNRYGISGHGEQYRGFSQLGAGVALGKALPMSREDAARVLVDIAGHSYWDGDDGVGLTEDERFEDAVRMIVENPNGQVRDAYRWASKLHHPDTGTEPDPGLFSRATEARDILEPKKETTSARH